MKWISVDERLPDDFDGVLMYIKNDGYKWVHMGVYEGGQEWFIYDERMDLMSLAPEESVTHWMPLPDPPEVKP